MVINSGSGNDTFEIRATHTGETVLDTGAGNDRVDVFATSGNTTVITGIGNDIVRVGGLPVGYAGPAGQTMPVRHVLSSIRGVLVVSGAETLINDDRADTTGDVTIVDDSSITGNDMGPQSEIRRSRSTPTAARSSSVRGRHPGPHHAADRPHHLHGRNTWPAADRR